jgi:hypothetical protein
VLRITVAAGCRPAVMKVASLSGRRQLSKTLNNKKYRERLKNIYKSFFSLIFKNIIFKEFSSL